MRKGAVVERRGWRAHESRMVDAKVVGCVDVATGVREIRLRGPAFGVVTAKPGAHVPVEVGAGVHRTYSVWTHDPGTASLALRIVSHSAGGPGARWAASVPVGQRVRIGLPRNRITLEPAARYHVFVGEETGAVPLLTMVAAVLSGTPSFGVFEAADAAHELSIPDGRGLAWVHRGGASAVNSPVLLRAVRALDLPPGGGGVAYVAGESATCRAVTRHFLQERGWPRHAVRVQTHWTPGKSGLE